MKAVVTMRFYGYMDTNTITKRKKDEIIKNFIENKYVNRKLKKKSVGGNSLSRVSVLQTDNGSQNR